MVQLVEFSFDIRTARKIARGGWVARSLNLTIDRDSGI